MRYSLLMFFILIVGFLPVRAEEQPAPYLYYYSDTLQGFVVERADGSDSRVLGREWIGETIHPIGWSPSGKWLAWTDYRLGTQDRLWHIISVDGKQHFEWPMGNTAIHFVWSPVDDLLFGNQQLNPTVSEDDQTHFMLIDVTNKETITQFARTPDYANSLTEAVWSPDGQFIAFYYQTRDPVSREGAWHFVLVSREGEVTEQTFNPTSFHPDIGLPLVHWTPQGWIAHLTPARDRLVIMHPSSGDQFEAEVSIEHARVASTTLIWSPAGDYALLYAANPHVPDVGVTYDLWRLSIPDRQLTLIAEKVFPDNLTYYLDPFQVALYNFTDADLKASWSPDGTQVVFRTSEDAFAVLNAETGQVHPLLLEVPADAFGRYNINIRWSPDSQTLQFQNEFLDSPILTIDTRTGRISEIDTFTIMRTAYSPSGRFLATAGRDGDILDLQTGRTYTLPIHSASVYNKVGHIWSPREDWLITVDHLCISGGCPAILRYAVTNPTGTYWRELENAEVSWLPMQVNVSNLPPGVSESVLLAPETVDRSVEFAYGSEDNTLQVGCDPADEYAFLIYERATGNLLYRLRDTVPCAGAGGGVNIGLSPNGKLLAVAARYSSNVSKLWDVTTGQLLARLNCTCFEMQFSEDGSQLFARASSAMLVWDVAKVLQHAGITQ
jgi:WD40 repeat protein